MNDHTLSNLHGKISYENGKWIYEDLETTNGSWYKLQNQKIVDNNLIFKLGSGNYVYKCKVFEEDVNGGKIPNLEDRNLCYLCQLNEKNVIVRPCNHCCFCLQCANQQEKCYLCEKDIL